MTNLLSQRLRNAKRELTNLKTAHRRGIGNIKIYTYDLQVTTTGQGTSIFNLVVEFSDSSVAYPFVQVWGSMKASDGDYNMSTLGGGYTNNGRTFKLMSRCWPEPEFDMVYIEAAAPISSVSYTWGR